MFEVLQIPLTFNIFSTTETGSPITSTCIGLGNSLTPPAGQAGRPVPGYNGKVSLLWLYVPSPQSFNVYKSPCVSVSTWRHADKGNREGNKTLSLLVKFPAENLIMLFNNVAAPVCLRPEHNIWISNISLTSPSLLTVTVIDDVKQSVQPRTLGNIVVK